MKLRYLFVFFALLMFSLTVFGASTNTTVNAALIAKAGSELQAYVSQLELGEWVQLGGAVLTLLGAFVSMPVMTVGEVITFVGQYITSTAVEHIDEAGSDLKAAATP